jgi:DNA-binding FadR family transcriptional regulator
MVETSEAPRRNRGGAARVLADRIRAGLVEEGARYGDRLPSERALCAAYDTSRHRMRAALALLEEMGLIWRHVGRGTFVGARPIVNLEEVAYLGELVTFEQIITVRMSIEPDIAALAARHATRADLARLATCHARCREAEDWSGYEAWDNNLHHAVARASQNKLFQHFFETVNVLRRGAGARAPHRPPRPAPDCASFAQHAAIVDAIARSDAAGARAAMLAHLASVHARMLRPT